SAGRSFDLDLADGFKGFVLAAATEKLAGDKDRAFSLFGKDKLLKGRNHHKVFRRELERAAELAAACGVVNFPFEGLLLDAPVRSEIDQPQVLKPNVEWR